MPVIARYRNPVIDTDFPDPSILAAPVDGWWWAHSTQHTTIERWAHVPVAGPRIPSVRGAGRPARDAPGRA